MTVSTFALVDVNVNQFYSRMVMASGHTILGKEAIADFLVSLGLADFDIVFNNATHIFPASKCGCGAAIEHLKVTLKQTTKTTMLKNYVFVKYNASMKTYQILLRKHANEVTYEDGKVI